MEFAKQKQLVNHLRNLYPAKGCNKTAVSYFDLHYFSADDMTLPENGKPYLYYVADGSVHFHTPPSFLFCRVCKEKKY